MNDTTFRQLISDKTNFVFLGEAGSGKSEISINFAKKLAELNEKPVHFFDMDMTKPLFRSRDVIEDVEKLGITFHHEVQFYDAPVLVGGVNLLLKDEDCYVVLDVGGDHIGARSIGGFAPKINKDSSLVYYVLNVYRPWSYDIDHIDHTLAEILGISHIELGKVHMINNPNIGITTTKEEFIEGNKKMAEMINPYKNIDFTCINDELYDDSLMEELSTPIMPINLFLTYPWL